MRQLLLRLSGFDSRLSWTQTEGQHGSWHDEDVPHQCPKVYGLRMFVKGVVNS